MTRIDADGTVEPGAVGPVEETQWRTEMAQIDRTHPRTPDPTAPAAPGLEQVLRHLTAAYLEVRRRECAAALIAALELGLEESGGAVVVLDRRGKVAYAPGMAAELMASYWGWRPGASGDLPPALADWLGATTDRPFVVTGARGMLCVRLAGAGGAEPWRALLLRERRAEPPSAASLRALGLTIREAQVLRLLCCGKHDREIARELVISSATVRKHLEHVYRKLGVDSRAQAVVRALG